MALSGSDSSLQGIAGEKGDKGDNDVLVYDESPTVKVIVTYVFDVMVISSVS